MVEVNILEGVFLQTLPSSQPCNESNDYPPPSVKTYWILRGTEKELHDEK